MILASTPFAGANASEDDEFWAEREAELRAMLEGAPPADAAGALLAVRAPDASQEAYLDAARAALALEAGAATDEFANAIVEAALAEQLRAIGAAATNDAASILAAQAAGTLTREHVQEIDLSAQGVRENADLLAGLAKIDAARVLSLADALEAPRTTWQQETWDTYGLALEVAYLLVASQSSDLAGWILPHDIRVFNTYAATRMIGPIQEGNVNNGRIWTQLYADIIVGIAMDNHGLTDALLLQLPISIYIEVNWRCTSTFFGVCVGWAFGSVTGAGDSLIATNASYTFAYPANGGEFPTRVTGQDLIQSVYDRIGTLPHAAPTDYAFRSHMADTPGVADLSTQAPQVTFFGLQVSPDLVLLREVVRNTRVHPPAPILTQEIPEAGLTVPVDSYNVGPTAGYTATEVRAYELTWLIVRWHNLGVGSADTDIIDSAPATFYYDVPPGQYKLTDARVDQYGGVLIKDWALAGDLPAAAPSV